MTLDLLLGAPFPGCISRVLASTHDPFMGCPRPGVAWGDWHLARWIVTLSNIKWAVHKFKTFKSAGRTEYYLPSSKDDQKSHTLWHLPVNHLLWVHAQHWRIDRVLLIPKCSRPYDSKHERLTNHKFLLVYFEDAGDASESHEEEGFRRKQHCIPTREIDCKRFTWAGALKSRTLWTEKKLGWQHF